MHNEKIIAACQKKYHGFYHEQLILNSKPKKDEDGNVIGYKVEIQKCAANYAIILQHRICPNLIRFDTFDGNEYLANEIMLSHHHIDLQVSLERFLDDSVDVRQVKAACTYVSRLNKFNPFTAIFANLPATDTHYLDNWLTLVFGVEDDQLTRAYGKKWLMAAVARALGEEEVYVEGSLILYGKQGDWKTWFFKNINLKPSYYCGSKVDLSDTRRASLTYAGSHICELSELTQFAKMEEEDIKQFLTQTSDKFDKKYENQSAVVKRGFIFGGSTNKNDFLKDHTGSRRFWVVEVKTLNYDMFRQIKDALWYEAYQAYLNADRNQPLDPWVLNEEERKLCNERNKQFAATDLVMTYLHDLIYTKNLTNDIRAREINEYLQPHHLGYTDKKVSDIMQNHFGWTKVNRNDGVHYVRPLEQQKNGYLASPMTTFGQMQWSDDENN